MVPIDQEREKRIKDLEAAINKVLQKYPEDNVGPIINTIGMIIIAFDENGGTTFIGIGKINYHTAIGHILAIAEKRSEVKLTTTQLPYRA